MNTRQLINELSGPVSLSVSYNSNCTCFAVGLDTGFCIFNTESCELETARDFNAGIGTAEMLDRTNYVALVGGGRKPKFPPNKVVLWDDGKQKVTITLELLTQVHGVRLSRSNIVIVLLNSVHIYEFCSPPRKLFVFETADNLAGLCCLGSKIVAFPGQTSGKVQIVELGTGNISIIPAHETSLRAMDLTSDGELLATASGKGTLVKIFSTGNCAKIAELRRGIDHARIFSIRFSPDNRYLAATSDKSTLHVFDVLHPVASSPAVLSDNANEQDSNHSQKWGILGRIPFMPRAFSDVYSFASAHFESNDGLASFPASSLSTTTQTVPGVPGGRASKGVIGWLNELTIVVIGAGRDGRWERFVIVAGDDGKRYCLRDGWKRFLGR